MVVALILLISLNTSKWYTYKHVSVFVLNMHPALCLAYKLSNYILCIFEALHEKIHNSYLLHSLVYLSNSFGSFPKIECKKAVLKTEPNCDKLLYVFRHFLSKGNRKVMNKLKEYQPKQSLIY